MKKRSLKFKLIAGGVMIVILPLLVVGWFAESTASKAVVHLAEDRAFNIARDLANMTEMVLEEELNIVRGIAVQDLTRDAFAVDGGDAPQRLASQLARYHEQLGDKYEGILVANSTGGVIADSVGGKYRTIDITDRDYFKAAMQKKTTIGIPVLSKSTGKPIVVAAAPVVSVQGEVQGMVGTVLKLDGLAERMLVVKLGETGYPWMVDQNGVVIVHPNSKHILKTNLAQLKDMKEIMTTLLDGNTGVEPYVFEGIPKIAGYAAVGLTGWGVGVTQNTDEFMASSRAIRNMILLVGVLFLVFTVVGVMFFSSSITKPIGRIVEGLSSGAEQVNSAASQVAEAGQSLAEGASEQAASIEETSASLEEMSSITKQSADNAGMADRLMQETNQVVAQANSSMDDLTNSMADISSASEETQKIIKTIDEIAFQTNLLALNAAVEAARAGEAGAGFAVVADEVRNLAMRAAEAAKNTAGLIESTVSRVAQGSDLVSKTKVAFDNVTENSGKVGELISEIAASSVEQSQGISQVNVAVSEMDQVVQSNASGAEESASAAEELSAQSETMHAMVEDLVRLINGGGGQTMRPARGTERATHRPQPHKPAAKPNLRKPLLTAGSNKSEEDFLSEF